MSELFICIDCELANADAEPTALDKHGLCERCGSSSVVPVDVIKTLATKAKAPARTTEGPTESTRLRWEAMRAQRSRDNEPIREFLRSLIYSKLEEGYAGSPQEVLNNQLEDALTKWDGWSYYVHYPWETGLGEITNPAPGFLTIELTQSVKNAQAWYISIDAWLHSVRQLIP